MTASNDPEVDGAGLPQALHVTGPAPEHAEQLMLFGRFIGSWRLDWSGPDAAGRASSAIGELHVGWILGGHAVQDIWIVPGRGQAGAGVPPTAFHGSTIRFYDPAIDAWRSTWIEPINGLVRRFIGRPAGADIVLRSDEDEPRLRWSFTDITPISFTWRAEHSADLGRTWQSTEQMLATRSSPDS